MIQNKDYAFHADQLNKEWEKRLKKVKLTSSKDGKILFDIKHKQSLIGAIKKDNAKKYKHKYINPQFILDFDHHTAAYNQVPFNLSPSSEAVISDFSNLLEYMDGFDLFTKDTNRLKTFYWKILNYMFLSPFMSRLQYEGTLHGYEKRFFPMYMLIYGDSDAGKTKFIELTQKLMFNEYLPALTQQNFSRKPMLSLKLEVKGCPVFIDELTPTYWKYARDIVKMDDDLLLEDNIHLPVFVLSSNDIKTVPPEISKRIFVITLDNRLPRAVAAYNGKRIHNITKRCHNALYREYLRRMFDSVDHLIEEIRQLDEQDSENWIPDIFEISSTVLLNIMHDFNIDVPPEFHTFTWFDYMGDDVIAERSTSIIKDEYIHNSDIFHINNAKNELEIDFSCYDNNESKKKLQMLHDELPADVECKIVGTKAVLKLDAIQKHSGIQFKKKPFWRRI